MPVLNHVQMTKECLESLFASLGDRTCEVIIIDDCSRDNFEPMLKEMSEKSKFDFFYTKAQSPIGVTKGWNKGVSMSAGKYIAVVNNDILFSPGWADPLIKALEEDEKLMMACPLHTRHDLPADWPAGSTRHGNDFGGMLGCCFMMRGFDATHCMWDHREECIFPIDEEIVIWYNDNWLVNRITRDLGGAIREIPESYIHHFYSQTCNERAAPGFVRQTGEDKIAFEAICKKRNWL